MSAQMPAQGGPAPFPPFSDAASTRLVALIAAASAVLVANLYYAQPLIASIAPQVGIPADVAGLMVSVTQIGYGVGLFFLVPLADMVENKALVLGALAVAAAALVLLGSSHSAAPFFAASFAMGVCSASAQMLLPFVAHVVPPERRGRWGATSWPACWPASCWRGRWRCSWLTASTGAACSCCPPG